MLYVGLERLLRLWKTVILYPIPPQTLECCPSYEKPPLVQDHNVVGRVGEAGAVVEVCDTVPTPPQTLEHTLSLLY